MHNMQCINTRSPGNTRITKLSNIGFTLSCIQSYNKYNYMNNSLMLYGPMQ